MSALIKIACLLTLGWGSSAQAQQTVIVNGQQLPSATVQQLENFYQIKIQSGRYWYDPSCGLWGLEGGPAQGGMMPGLRLGGPLRADASSGQTGIFINGRQINQRERAQWEQLTGPITPGRYWLDAYGNVGMEGGPALVNLLALAQQTPSRPNPSASQQNTGNSNTFYRNFYTDTGSGSSSDGFYIIGEDWSYSDF
jgi:hypothetical protein